MQRVVNAIASLDSWDTCTVCWSLAAYFYF